MSDEPICERCDQPRDKHIPVMYGTSGPAGLQAHVVVICPTATYKWNGKETT
jgi:hypothetical protein